MSVSFQKMALLIAVVLVSVAVFLIIIGKRTHTTDCEIARLFYIPNEENSFETFLEEQFRVFGVVESGSFFTGPRYGLAVYYPYNENVKYKEYRYLISRSGIPYSQMSLSINKKGWDSGSRVECK